MRAEGECGERWCVSCARVLVRTPTPAVRNERGCGSGARKMRAEEESGERWYVSSVRCPVRGCS